jgi:hypothetical protein
MGDAARESSAQRKSQPQFAARPAFSYMNPTRPVPPTAISHKPPKARLKMPAGLVYEASETSSLSLLSTHTTLKQLVSFTFFAGFLSGQKPTRSKRLAPQPDRQNRAPVFQARDPGFLIV